MSNIFYNVGIRCHHEVYGFGTIISNDLDNQKTRIHFDNGFEENFTTVNLIRSPRFKTLPENLEEHTVA